MQTSRKKIEHKIESTARAEPISFWIDSFLAINAFYIIKVPFFRICISLDWLFFFVLMNLVNIRMVEDWKKVIVPGHVLKANLRLT